MDLTAFVREGDLITVSFLGGFLLLIGAFLLFMFSLGLREDGFIGKSVFGISVGAGITGAVSLVVVFPIALVATWTYTPPPVPVPASKVSLSEADGQDRQAFAVVCSGHRGSVELVGERRGRLFLSEAYRLRIRTGDISQPVSFSVGLRWENRGWGGRFGGQPSWMENVVSGDEGIRADGTWQEGYLDRPIILSEEGEYVLRVDVGGGPCPHLISIS